MVSYADGESIKPLQKICNIQQETDIHVVVTTLDMTALRLSLSFMFKYWMKFLLSAVLCRFSPVSESAPVGTPVGLILAAAVNTTVFYSIVDGNQGGEFSEPPGGIYQE